MFTRTKHGANRLAEQLGRDGINAAAIHGNKSQGQRIRALDDFKAGRADILVATDIAARGIDVEGITHVINYDLPNEPESYVHRIGRTARAGAAGAAISLCSTAELPHLRAIEKLIRRAIPADARRATAAPPSQPRGKAEPRPQRSQGPRRPHPLRRDVSGSSRHELATVPFLQPSRREESGRSARVSRKQWRRA